MNTSSLPSPWTPDLNDGMYKNPIIYADYSDPDIIRVGNDFYMTASSFHCSPGLPILHSTDLISWTLINHAIQIFPDDRFNQPRHGSGVWAPSIRFHNGKFYIYYGDPDIGIFMVKTRDPRKTWDPPVLVKKAYGNIDPCPFWDDDGNAYLVHAFAHSRAGINSVLQINKMTPDGTRTIDEGQLIFDGHAEHPIIEGPKVYKRNGYYYVFAPAGGVATGWQTVLRSKNIYGPYEFKNVLSQGNTLVNGPHQGGYVELDQGECWFVHFQEVHPHGRIVHLQPMTWHDDWPVIGTNPDQNGLCEPVPTHKKPTLPPAPFMGPQASDNFNRPDLGLQWQWQANYNPAWWSLTDNPGKLRLVAQEMPKTATNLWPIPSLLLQKFPAPSFRAITKIEVHSETSGAQTGLIIFGKSYGYIALKKESNQWSIQQVQCTQAMGGSPEKVVASKPVATHKLYLATEVTPAGTCTFSYSTNGTNYHVLGKEFSADQGLWVGSKIGLFSTAPTGVNAGYSDIDFFHITSR